MKKIDTSKLKKGDIILSTSTAPESLLIRTAIRSDISHAMLYVANGSVMDSTSEGVQARNIQKIFYDDDCALYAYRPIVDLPQEEIDKVVNYVRSETGSPYTKKEAAASVLPLSRSGGKNQFCSRLVARAYASVGFKIADNPDFANPADIQNSSLLKQIPDVILTVSAEEAQSREGHGDTTIGMREKTNNLLTELRHIAPTIRVLNDVEPFLLKNPQCDTEFANAYRNSGYLTHWKIEVERFPWRYDPVAIAQFYHAIDDDGKEALLDYCRDTIRQDIEGDFKHWEVNATELQKLTAMIPLETFQLNLQLYLTLCFNHKRRVDSARALLQVYGSRPR
ncbi:hypothetical protein J3L14_28305 [Burkholderia pseudomallei]|uniref:YiiX/YebB-like N1pC/P60 family cysteine hydrolase n=1 Tax=Burkholderia pseudomallei TaxID=28450 RepID=UPI001A9D65CA|nr:YiiX/YebB-like N1pC/P60 family cysteine hydrolase [Burkholderia pseudomallei]QTB81923.1 hypothetical protein J3L14_28305 [Burkholderia pseudomallei]